MKETIYIELNDGKFVRGAKRLGDYLKSLSGRFTVEIEKTKSKRSEQQNKYYWKVVVNDQIDCIRQAWGEIWSKDDMHSFNKIYFFGDERVNELTGEIIKVPKSSANKSKDEFSEAIEKIKQFFYLQFNYRIKEANEQVEIFS